MKNNNLIMVILLATLLVLTINTLNLVYAQEENRTNPITSDIVFLFVQSAKSGTIEKFSSNDTNSFGTHILTLNNMSQTIKFSESPDRIVSPIDTNQFVKDWYSGGQKTDSFKSDPPNAALIIHGVNAGVIELLNPVYDTNTQTIQYHIQPLENNSLNIPNEVEEITLVIDCG
ncbi:MAG: hypothetical protein ACPKQO_03555 [Nitrososphaeraceae archaeon]